MNRLEKLLSMLESNPGDSFITFALAKEYEGLEELEKAKDLYEKLIESDPAYIGTYYHLAKLFELLDEPEKALIIYQKGIEISTEKNDLHALAELKNAKMNTEMEL